LDQLKYVEYLIMRYKWEADYDVTVKVTSVTDNVLKSKNGAI
ncbi:11401_t:CDS:2, partial [Funneliformis mosseae]